MDDRGRRAPTPKALEGLAPVPHGYRILPDPLGGQPLTRVPARPAEVRLLLSRSSESARSDEPSQDYLVVRHDPRHLAFAVCDGVGSSFLGDVAAQILAAALTDWLVSGAPLEALPEFLRQLSARVADQVAAWPLPAQLSPIMRDALDAQRSYGSEAMFAAGVVSFRAGTVALAWLGDVRCRVISRYGTTIDRIGQTSDRWSSKSGPRGTIDSATWPLADLARVIVGTDGLADELDAVVTLPDPELADRLDALALRPRNDDIALVDIGLVPRAIPGDGGTMVSPGRHARSSGAGSVVRRIMRAVTPPVLAADPVSAPPSTPVSAPPSPTPARDASAAALTAGVPSPSTPSPSAPSPNTPSPNTPSPNTSSPGAPSSATGAPTAAAPPPVASVPAPVIMRRRLERGQEIIWNPVDGAASYAVQVSREPRFAEPIDYAVRALSFTVPPLPDPVYARIRSVTASGEAGPWGPKYDLSLSEPE